MKRLLSSSSGKRAKSSKDKKVNWPPERPIYVSKFQPFGFQGKKKEIRSLTVAFVLSMGLAYMFNLGVVR
ncbi:hypothetical protein BASA81_002152 [Batrachochytrium salamandrivorans]|nr:hypothetical protein BASA81_002152 [Batrachochytrium salamandrivorans]